MDPVNRRMFTLTLAAAAASTLGLKSLPAQDRPDPNSAPNPYRMVDSGIRLPEGRKMGAPIGVEIDHSDGKTLWCSIAAAETPAPVPILRPS